MPAQIRSPSDRLRYKWKDIHLPDRQLLARALPGEGNYFTNVPTSLRADNPTAYEELLQIAPSKEFPARPIIQIGRIDQVGGFDTAIGVTRANTQFGSWRRNAILVAE